MRIMEPCITNRDVHKLQKSYECTTNKEKKLSNDYQFIEVSSVCQRGWWPWVGEGDPSYEGHECDLGASPLVHLPHTPTPRISCHSTWHVFVEESVKLTEGQCTIYDNIIMQRTRKKVVSCSYSTECVCFCGLVKPTPSLPPSLPQPGSKATPHERRDYPLVRLTFRTFVMSL